MSPRNETASSAKTARPDGLPILLVGILSLSCIATSPSEARAESPLETILTSGAEPEFLTIGANVSFLFPGDSERPLELAFGVEGSYVQFQELFYYGVIGDLRYDISAEAVGLGVGPEIGWAFFSLDLLLYGRVGDSSAIGVRPRACATLAPLVASLTLCGGAEITSEEIRGELTLSLKAIFGP